MFLRRHVTSTLRKPADWSQSWYQVLNQSRSRDIKYREICWRHIFSLFHFPLSLRNGRTFPFKSYIFNIFLHFNAMQCLWLFQDTKLLCIYYLWVGMYHCASGDLYPEVHPTKETGEAFKDRMVSGWRRRSSSTNLLCHRLKIFKLYSNYLLIYSIYTRF